MDVLNFYEKPNKLTAEKFLEDGNFLWNSGIFMFKASVITQELNKYAPDILSNCKKSLDNSRIDLEFKRLNKENFIKCSNISIDIAVMEKTKMASVVPIDIGWNDVGSWSAMWEISKKDKNGNVNVGKIKTIDCNNNYLRSENRLVVGIGLENMVVVETNDAVLVANRENIQKVKDVVNQLKKEGNSEGLIIERFSDLGEIIFLLLKDIDGK